jgi:hypothetical protein
MAKEPNPSNASYYSCSTIIDRHLDERTLLRNDGTMSLLGGNWYPLVYHVVHTAVVLQLYYLQVQLCSTVVLFCRCSCTVPDRTIGPSTRCSTDLPESGAPIQLVFMYFDC